MIASVVWSKLGLTCIPHSTTKGKHMTMDEVLEALEKSGVEFEVTAEHEDGMHVIVKFQPEENADA
jgi:hypothetical protein